MVIAFSACILDGELYKQCTNLYNYIRSPIYSYHKQFRNREEDIELACLSSKNAGLLIVVKLNKTNMKLHCVGALWIFNYVSISAQMCPLVTWINPYLSMDKYGHVLKSVKDITYLFPKLNGCNVDVW